MQSLAFLEWAAIRQGALLSDIKLLSQLSSDSLARLLFGVHRADVQGCSNSRCRSCCRYLLPSSVSGKQVACIKGFALRLCWYAEY